MSAREKQVEDISSIEQERFKIIKMIKYIESNFPFIYALISGSPLHLSYSGWEEVYKELLTKGEKVWLEKTFKELMTKEEKHGE